MLASSDSGRKSPALKIISPKSPMASKCPAKEKNKKLRAGRTTPEGPAINRPVKQAVPKKNAGRLNIPNQRAGLSAKLVSILIRKRSRKTFQILDKPYLLLPNLRGW